MKAYACIFISTLTLIAPPAIAQTNTDYETARHILKVRCAICHSAIPQEDGLNAGSQPPKGVKFDTDADLQKFALQIQDQAVDSKLMPPDNATHITDEERAALGKWIKAGATVP